MSEAPVDEKLIEPGIWPLVKCANDCGYPTIGSCEGHSDGREAHIVFSASNDDALRIHRAVREAWNDLKCNWQLTAQFLVRNSDWVLTWKLENWGVKDAPPERADWLEANAEAGQKDIPRLVTIFEANRAS
jgi:hypothetical protein